MTKRNIQNLSSWTQSVSTRFCAKRKDEKSTECDARCIYCTCVVHLDKVTVS